MLAAGEAPAVGELVAVGVPLQALSTKPRVARAVKGLKYLNLMVTGSLCMGSYGFMET
jgi:hypothetical protein